MVLVENDYLDSIKANHINPVWLNSVLENAIRSNNETPMSMQGDSPKCELAKNYRSAKHGVIRVYTQKK